MKNDVGETWIDKRLNLCRQQSGRNNRRGYCNGGSCASVFCHYSACNGIADKGIEEQICSGGTLRNEALHYRYCTCNRVLYGNQYLFQYQKRRRGNGYCCDCSHSSSVSCLFHLKKSDEKRNFSDSAYCCFSRLRNNRLRGLAYRKIPVCRDKSQFNRSFGSNRLLRFLPSDAIIHPSQ